MDIHAFLLRLLFAISMHAIGIFGVPLGTSELRSSGQLHTRTIRENLATQVSKTAPEFADIVIDSLNKNIENLLDIRSNGMLVNTQRLDTTSRAPSLHDTDDEDQSLGATSGPVWKRQGPGRINALLGQIVSAVVGLTGGTSQPVPA